MSLMRSLCPSYSPAPGHRPVQFTLGTSCNCCCCYGIQLCRSSSRSNVGNFRQKSGKQSEGSGREGGGKRVAGPYMEGKIERFDGAVCKTCPEVVVTPGTNRCNHPGMLSVCGVEIHSDVMTFCLINQCMIEPARRIRAWTSVTWVTGRLIHVDTG